MWYYSFIHKHNRKIILRRDIELYNFDAMNSIKEILQDAGRLSKIWEYIKNNLYKRKLVHFYLVNMKIC